MGRSLANACPRQCQGIQRLENGVAILVYPIVVVMVSWMRRLCLVAQCNQRLLRKSTVRLSAKERVARRAVNPVQLHRYTMHLV